MKRVLFFMTTLVVLAACSKNQDPATTQTQATSDFPVTANEYILDNYPDASVDYVMTLSSSPARFVAVLNTTEELAFADNGDFMGDGRMFHHGDSIPGDTVHCDTIPGWHHHGHHGHPGHGGPGGIDPDSLSTGIRSYIRTNYPQAHILRAGTDTICTEGAVTIVMIGIRGAEPIKLFFDQNDNFLISGKRHRVQAMPQAVKTYIMANYADYRISPAGEKFMMADNSIQYRVYAHKQRDRKCIRLLEDGTLVCVQ